MFVWYYIRSVDELHPVELNAFACLVVFMEAWKHSSIGGDASSSSSSTYYMMRRVLVLSGTLMK